MERVAIIGAGTMGQGIAQAAALGGYRAILYDVDGAALERATAAINASIDKGVARGKTPPENAQTAKENLQTTADLESTAVADLIIEAAPESLPLKQEIFASLDELAPPETILASNTSSLSINVLASATARPDRFIGLHFFNPAHIMKLVEVIPGDETSDDTRAAALAFVARLGKTAVIATDSPAFIVNRVARPFYGEAFRLLGERAADVATIDDLLKSIGFRMGPFELVDLIGCDINFAVTKQVYEAYFHDPKYRPHPLQERMVAAGRLGRKSGRGFYEYGGGK